jgi:exopolyphosphatase/guanosine-5'-triphosphate,3'-diphosphate pyrophosphatase
MLSAEALRRAFVLGRTLLLAYRFSGGVPTVLGAARLRLEADCVRLEVGPAPRAPDSEVVAERLRLLATALGVKRSEIVLTDEAPEKVEPQAGGKK